MRLNLFQSLTSGTAVLRRGLLALALVTAGAGSAAADTIASWTFESSLPIAAGPYSPEVGAGSATGFHSAGSTYSNPVGNGSAESFSSTNWVVGDYYQFQTSTVGMTGIAISWDQTSSNTGPRDFQLQYSTNGTTFINIGSAYSVLANNSPNPVWNGTTYNAIYTFAQNLSAFTALDNAPAIYFRLTDASTVSANGGTVASTGTDRVDNFTITGSPVPEPSSLALVGCGAAGAAAMVARRRRVRK
jgi:hypothetical protein